MKSIYLFLFLVILKFSFTFSQKLTFTIIDEETEMPIPYIGIQIVGTKSGIYTNNQGEFQLKNTVDSIQITHLGYYPLKLKIAETSNVILLKPKSEMLDEVIVKSGKPQEKTIGYGKEKRRPDWSISAKNQLATLIEYKKNFKDAYIKTVYIPIGKVRNDTVNKKSVEIEPEFNSVIRFNIFSNKNNYPGDILLKKPILIKRNQNSDDILNVDLSSEFISFPNNGVFVVIEMIGKTDDEGNIIENTKGIILPSFKFTKKKEKNLFSISYLKTFYDDNNSWLTIEERHSEFADLLKYNMAISITLDVYEE